MAPSPKPHTTLGTPVPEAAGGQEAADQSLDVSTLEPLGTSSGSRAAPAAPAP
jgi:hypothetical protein